MIVFCFECYGADRDLHVLTHSFPTLRSSDLRWFLTYCSNRLISERATASTSRGSRVAVDSTTTPRPARPPSRSPTSSTRARETPSTSPLILPSVSLIVWYSDTCQRPTCCCRPPNIPPRPDWKRTRLMTQVVTTCKPPR